MALCVLPPLVRGRLAAAYRYARQVYIGWQPFDPATETPAWAQSLPVDVKTKAIAEGQQFAAAAIANRSKP